MTDFVQFIISYLGRALYLSVPAVALCGILLALTARRFKKQGRVFPWGRALLWLALLGYFLILAVVTVGRPGGGGWHDANLRLFRAWKEAWMAFSQKHWLNILLNIAMFAPLGILLPLFGKKLQRWYLALGAGFCVSLAIEVIQYLTGRGLADVDDLFCNTLGCFAGYLLVMAILGLTAKSWRSALCHGLALLVLLGGIGSPFLLYSLQELGNLPDAPAYRVDAGDTQWHILCDLSQEGGTLPIYRTRVPTKAECEEIGRRVLRTFGADEIDVWYYNEEVYLRSGDRCVSVYYLDGRYSYWEFRDEAAASGESPDALREKLRGVGVELPEAAEFSVEEQNRYCFTVPAVREGDALLDGAVRFQLTAGGAFLKLDNDLVSFTHYREGAVISAREAAERLMAGWITSGDWFENDRPKAVEIHSCTPG